MRHASGGMSSKCGSLARLLKALLAQREVAALPTEQRLWASGASWGSYKSVGSTARARQLGCKHQ